MNRIFFTIRALVESICLSADDRLVAPAFFRVFRVFRGFELRFVEL